MRSLDKRVAALEKKTTPTEQITLIQRIVWVGQESSEIQQLMDEQGINWIREKCESEQAFVKRAKDEAWRNEWGVMVLNGFV